ncbi:phage terminase small subunit [Streptococcus gallolyticus]|uniref:Phage terminase small subunit n=1 Tax=Streptococcus gallolyticus TaxID=315405 RepID=A0A1I7JI07_9STRE|nr:terminase small subunit [Streptococcus gallolyticus]SFC82854.1 phage terminase small subunit [Streptococcus gallolyticus]SFU84776.1 phage terminase small subunit [Streptococcus gallolyticus]
MNERQRRFADEYIRIGNAEQAAIRAGYSEKYARGNAHKLVANVSIKNYINEQIQRIRDESIMDAKEALAILSEIARGNRDEEVLILNPTTGKVERHTKKADNATVIKAITEILKRYPTAKQAEKLELELAKLREQVNANEAQDDKIVIVDEWAEEVDDGL